MKRCFLVQSYGRTGTQFISHWVSSHRDVVCVHGLTFDSVDPANKIIVSGSK